MHVPENCGERTMRMEVLKGDWILIRIVREAAAELQPLQLERGGRGSFLFFLSLWKCPPPPRAKIFPERVQRGRQMHLLIALWFWWRCPCHGWWPFWKYCIWICLIAHLCVFVMPLGPHASAGSLRSFNKSVTHPRRILMDTRQKLGLKWDLAGGGILGLSAAVQCGEKTSRATYFERLWSADLHYCSYIHY